TKALRTWAPVVDDAARRLVERWKTRNSSTPLNVHTEFGISLLDIVGKMLLGESLDEEAAHVIRTAIGIAASLAQDVPQANLLTRSAEGSSESANRTYKERYREF